MTHRQRALTVSGLFLTAACVLAFAQTPQENVADAARLVEALGIHSGSTVAEIGAGGGELTVAIAREVGDTGRVLSNDLNPKWLADVGQAVEKAGLHNVTLVQGHERETNLPPGCCDAIFMRSVYHHFADPGTMNKSLFDSLKPGGRLAVIDFAPDGDESPDPKGRADEKHHGVTGPTVARELQGAGFAILTMESIRNRAFIVVARRPE
jgi:ubiquinone/menaquinone biosynthesis C-methylase UbiE